MKKTTPKAKAPARAGKAKAAPTRALDKIKSVREARDRQARLAEEAAKKTLAVLKSKTQAALAGAADAGVQGVVLKASKSRKTSASDVPVVVAPPSPEVLAHVHSFALDAAGRDGLRVVKAIGDEGTTDEIIEKRTKLKIAQVRSLLNHLHSYGIVEYGREKNLQSGWFTYTWRVNAHRAFSNFLMNKRKEYEVLRKEMSTMDGAQVYRCKKDCDGIPFERAMEMSFKCPSCKNPLAAGDPATERARVEEKLNTIQKILDMSTERTALGDATKTA